MGVSHGKKKDLQHLPQRSKTHLSKSGKNCEEVTVKQDDLCDARNCLNLQKCFIDCYCHERVKGMIQDLEMQTHQTEQQDLYSEFQAPLLHSEDESCDLIKPQKPHNPITASKCHQELHRELRLTHNRRVLHEGKSELQRALEKRKWEQRMKASRDRDEAQKSGSSLQQELLRRQQRLEKQERDKEQQREGPEFLQVKEKLRRTAVLDAGQKEV